MNLPLRVLPLLVTLSLLACGDPPSADLTTPVTPMTPSCGGPGVAACPSSQPSPSADYGVTCRKDSDCVAPGTSCEYVGDGMAQCLSACATNDGTPDPTRCPGGTVCRGGYPLCVVGCSADAQCRATERCVSGACLATPMRGAGGGGGSSGAGGGGGGGNASPPVNQAEVVWKAQEDVDETVNQLRETQGAWMIDWLRLARATAGASGNVTTGTLTERSANTWGYAPGTQALRVVRANGSSFSIIVLQLVGSIASTTFPKGNDRLIGTFDQGSSALKVDLADNAAAFDGTYFDAAGVRTTVNVKETGTRDSWPDGSAYRLFTSRSTSGTVTRDATTVAFSVTHTLESCSGACTGLSMRLYLDHEVTVTSASGVWNLKYLTGFQQPVGQLPTHTWTGSIWSGSNEVGGLTKRKVGALTELNVFLGASLYRVRTVTEP